MTQYMNVYTMYKHVILLCVTISAYTTHTLSLEDANKQMLHALEQFIHGNIHDAYTQYKELLVIFPKSCALLQNCARAAYELNHYQEALHLIEYARTLKPDDISLRYDHAIVLLATGNYAYGFRLYESRWHKPDKQSFALPYPQWRGEPLRNKTILLLSEGGYGDTFQFVRFAQELKKESCTILLLTKSALIPLIHNCPYLDVVTDHIPRDYTIDYWSSLMSIPAHVQTTLETIPCTIPYLYTNPDRTAHVAPYINLSNFNIGICFTPDMVNDMQRPPLARRAIDRTLFDLFALPSVQLYELTPGVLFPDFDREPFTDSAALITQLDLVITVDTAIAHLAGALGTPTWILLPYKADWRWMTNRTDSPWYPSVKLFRNNASSNWYELCTHVAQQLANHIKEQS